MKLRSCTHEDHQKNHCSLVYLPRGPLGFRLRELVFTLTRIYINDQCTTNLNNRSYLKVKQAATHLLNQTSPIQLGT